MATTNPRPQVAATVTAAGRGGFPQWRGLGLDLPEVELAPGLSNIDEVTAALLQELRSKGIAK
ncbi:hypothetical protein [Streptomyces sp. NBC_01443]|uniref:hypothetical protein n=1 Tax=Streptomyces sp. NBC_01443 TaxID=2903868 RepID=UPI00224DF6B5|nr:hypothetical protein [Streptomyces sp. NBC_01443]MCX4629011.1 hypothetical protein [Streptomyces sp. NBC_01443]